jgi:dihydrofolate reductase
MIECLVAVGKDGGIGTAQGIPWHIPADLKRFKDMTTGHVVIMGRKTFATLNDTPLPKRTNIVVTKSTPSSTLPNGLLYMSLEQCKAYINEQFTTQRIFVIGGEQLYDALEGFISIIHMTEVFHSEEYSFNTHFFPITSRYHIDDVSETNVKDDDISYRFVRIVRA